MNDLKEIEAAPPAPRSPLRQIFTWVGLILVVATAIVGSNMFSIRDRLLGSAIPSPSPPASSRVAGQSQVQATPAATTLRSAPWWQSVTTLEGAASVPSSTFAIDKGSLQWRVKWSCPAGHLIVRNPKYGKTLVDAACTKGDFAYGTHTGDMSLAVTADGPWRLEVAQQVDTPLVEPPLPAMTDPGAVKVASGSFYKIDKTGIGKATVYHQADGRYSIRLEDFFVTPNVDLQLRLSALEAPHTSPEFINAHSELVATMDVSAGSLNYTVPDGIDPTKFRSIVIWCAPVNSAYAGATLVASQ